MQFSTLLSALVAAFAAHASAQNCLQNGQPCASDGSEGNCCSGFCLAEGGIYGECADGGGGVTMSARAALPTLASRQCLPQGQPCAVDGSEGNCCSDFCLSYDGNYGTCESQVTVSNTARALPTTLTKRQCLANGQACASDGSEGSCCSGFCLAEGGIYGTCEDQGGVPPPPPPPEATL